MSFASSVKKELASLELIPPCCLHAQVYGLVLFAHFASYDISITSEHPDVRRLYAEGLEAMCGVTPDGTQKEGKKVTLELLSQEERMKVFEAFGHSKKDLVLRINRSNIQKDCCQGAFIRGAFLACGTISDPNKNYKLEFVISHSKLANDFVALLEECGFSPKTSVRNGYVVVYFRDSESVEDVLTIMGAPLSSLEIMGIKMQKDIVNRVNRRFNFEMSNLNKTIGAAERQTQAIEYIESTCGIDALPENLQEISRLRLENPEVSLKELGQMLSKPLSRSGVNHRLARIVEIANEKMKD